MNLLRAAALLLLLYFLYLQFSTLDFSHVRRLLIGIGAAGVLIMLPYAGVISLDAAGWRGCMTPSRSRLSLRGLSMIRLSTDAVMNTVPAGVAIAETLRPLLLQKHFGLRTGEAVASTMLAKINMAVTQMIFVILAVLLLTLQEGSRAGLGLVGTTRGQALVISLSVAFLLLLLLPYAGVRLQGITTLLSSLRLPPLSRLLGRIHGAVREIDNEIARFVRGSRTQLASVLGIFLLSWLMTAAETWLIFYLLGQELTLAQAAILEGLLSAIKLVFFFIPSGLGAQELGIPAILGVFGVPEVAVMAAAFIILRRGKELAWTTTGLALFGALGVNPFRPALRKT
jgi:uncharacterized membrane protein YbhN (UPF0104 family)